METDAPATSGKVLHRARAYDALAWVLTLGRERRFRDRLVALAHLEPGDSVLDVGCGTGALAIAARDRVGSGGQVCGVDPSPEMVARARAKAATAAKAGADFRFETATVEALPFADATFDAVLSTLMLHHLSEEGRRQGIGEIARVLKPGGRFLAVDTGGGGDAGGKHHSLFHLVRRHAHFDLDELVPVLEGPGLGIVEQGSVPSTGTVGLPPLRFILAAAPAS